VTQRFRFGETVRQKLNMEIRDLMYLEASAAAGNFTRAAKSLGLDSSTISRRVGRFEDELGLALFERVRSPSTTPKQSTSWPAGSWAHRG
jgi:DNA-binding MarR family transcriptional regulator